jgi:hypothetical protein
LELPNFDEGDLSGGSLLDGGELMFVDEFGGGSAQAVASSSGGGGGAGVEGGKMQMLASQPKKSSPLARALSGDAKIFLSE